MDYFIFNFLKMMICIFLKTAKSFNEVGVVCTNAVFFNATSILDSNTGMPCYSFARYLPYSIL